MNAQWRRCVQDTAHVLNRCDYLTDQQAGWVAGWSRREGATVVVAACVLRAHRDLQSLLALRWHCASLVHALCARVSTRSLEATIARDGNRTHGCRLQVIHVTTDNLQTTRRHMSWRTKQRDRTRDSAARKVASVRACERAHFKPLVEPSNAC